MISPEKQLALYLAKGGFPDKDIPYVLKYCPQLIHHFSVEEIAAVALANHNIFQRAKYTIKMRPFVYEAAKRESGIISVYDYIEESAATCANDTLELSFAELFCGLKKNLEGGS